MQLHKKIQFHTEPQSHRGSQRFVIGCKKNCTVKAPTSIACEASSWSPRSGEIFVAVGCAYSRYPRCWNKNQPHPGGAQQNAKSIACRTPPGCNMIEQSMPWVLQTHGYKHCTTPWCGNFMLVRLGQHPRLQCKNIQVLKGRNLHEVGFITPLQGLNWFNPITQPVGLGYHIAPFQSFAKKFKLFLQFARTFFASLRLKRSGRETLNSCPFVVQSTRTT